MSNKRIGLRTIQLGSSPAILSCANIGGKLEKQGPLAGCFDELHEDSFFGEKTWEKAESRMQQKVVQSALDKAKLRAGDLDYIFAGDLLNQCIGTSFGLRDFNIPFFGLYGACSTMMVVTSAKSRLMNPVSRIRSEMDCTAWRSTSSAISNALAKVIF